MKDGGASRPELRAGFSYMARVLSCDRHTIAQGVQELGDAVELQRSRIRRTGEGRKRSQAIIPGLDAAFLQVVEHHTAGSPMNAAVKWTNLTRQEIVDYWLPSIFSIFRGNSANADSYLIEILENDFANL